MERRRKLSLQNEMDDEAKRIEEEMAKSSEPEKIQVSEEFDAALLKKIEEYEREKGTRKTVYRRKKKKFLLAGMAAVLILALGTGFVSIGSKSYWKTLWERLVGGEKATVINVEDMETKKTEDADDRKVYKEIDNELGISTSRIFYKPEGMSLENYIIDTEQRSAQLFYNYNGEIISYAIYVNDSDSSLGEKTVDTQTDKFTVRTEDMEITAEEYQVPNYDIPRYVAEFEYRGVHYQLKGIMEREELEKILKNLRFL